MAAAKAAQGVLRGGARPKKAAPRKNDWTKKKAEKFLAELAESCNVHSAARAIAVSTTTVYRRRAHDASFRAAWGQAIAQGYSRLELMLLERALHGVEKVVVARDGTSTTMRDYSDSVALALLRMHRAEVSEQEGTIDTVEVDEARERIMARIERLRARNAAGGTGRPGEGGAGAVEQKAASFERMVRIADLVSALRPGRKHGGAA